MNILNYIEQHPQEALRLIGLSYEQFKDVVIQAELQHQHQLTEQEKTKIRLNNQGGGRQKHLSVTEEILLTLIYLRHSLTFQLVGVQFGVSESKAHTTFHYWIVILRQLLPASLLEQVEKYSSNSQGLEEILKHLEQLVEIGEKESLQEILSKLELLVDSYEQPRERPLDNQEQKKYYSGKKKDHTFKNQIITLPEGKDLVDVQVGELGKTPDITIFREQKQVFASTQSFQGDKGYVGDPQIRTPHKKPQHQKLTEEKKQENKALSSQRIFVEHLIRLIKLFRVAKERFRLYAINYKLVILTICGLVRLRIGALNLSVENQPSGCIEKAPNNEHILEKFRTVSSYNALVSWN